MQIHAHPDDEASKGSGTTAKYVDQGVVASLVCCTGGEAGEILNPAVDLPEVWANLAEVRLGELRESAAAIGYTTLHLLGYHDSGMPGSEVNARPDNFANAPLTEVVGELVRIIRADRPHVMITYGDEQDFYPHPDHIRVHEATIPAFEAAGDPEQFPEFGEPWQPQKLYYAGFSFRRIRILHETILAQGDESPYEDWFARGFPDRDERFTTLIDVGDFLTNRSAALRAHRTQVDPNGFWFLVSDEMLRDVYPYEEFELARCTVDLPLPHGELEDDLFLGLRSEQGQGVPR